MRGGMRAVYREGDYLVTHSPEGRAILLRIAQGLALVWDRRAKEEYVIGRVAVMGNQVVILIDLSPQGRAFYVGEDDKAELA